MAKKILVVEDEVELARLMATWLKREGYEVFCAYEGLTGLKQVFENRPDLVLVDISMPLMDGFTLCRRIREVSDIPIIIVTAHGERQDALKGFDLGADDYITKPFDFAQLVARIMAVLRRCGRTTYDKYNIYSDSALSIDFAKREVRFHGKPVLLTPAEFILLTTLVRNVDKVLTWQELIKALDLEGEDAYNMVKWHMFSLRHKLGKEASTKRLIVNIHGVGYRYVPPSTLQK